MLGALEPDALQLTTKRENVAAASLLEEIHLRERQWLRMHLRARNKGKELRNE